MRLNHALDGDVVVQGHSDQLVRDLQHRGNCGRGERESQRQRRGRGDRDSQSTLILILLETLGGTPLVAMHRYAPMSRREMRVSSSVCPSHSSTAERGSGSEGAWVEGAHVPFRLLPRVILELSSRRHLIAGSGLPDARQRNVTFAPSRTITSLDVIESSMFGGTAGGEGS